MSTKHLDKIVSLCKRKGFVFPNSEIYGGLKASYDYGPLGVELKKAISEKWWKAMTNNSNIVGLDSSIMVHPDVWEASGHIANFNDPMTDNKDSKKRYRIDDLLSQQKVKLLMPYVKYCLLKIKMIVILLIKSVTLYFKNQINIVML